jgi:hypothetical protein
VHRPTRGTGRPERRWEVLWDGAVGKYDLRADELAILGEACRLVDDLAVMHAAVAESGAVVAGSKGQPHPNPLLPEVRASRVVLIRLARTLKLSDEPERPSRAAAQHRAATLARWARPRGSA